MAIISPSVLASDFSRLGDEVIRVEKGGAEYLHLDVMDGLFVPNISFGAGTIASVRPLTNAVFDVHLMINNPLKYIDDFIKAGADIITFHFESASPVEETIDKIISGGCKAGLSIKPNTPAQAVFPFLDKLKMVLVMTVEPGFGGQAFIPYTEPKIAEVRREIIRRGLDVDIEVDGGINPQTSAMCSAAGANVFVAGNSIFKAENATRVIAELRSAAESQTFKG